MENIVYIVTFVIICIERLYRNHLKSQTHTNNIRKRHELNESFKIISQY